MGAIIPTGIEYPIGSGTFQDTDSAEDVQTVFPLGSSRRSSATPIIRTVYGNYASYEGVNLDGRPFFIDIHRKHGATLTQNQFNDTVNKWFDPSLGRDGERFLRALHNDGSTVLRIKIAILSLDQHPEFMGAWRCEAVATVDHYESNSSSTGTGTRTNNGNVNAPVQLNVTGTSLTTGRKSAITDNTGHGLINWPIAVTSATAIDSDEAWLIVNGTSVPFNLSGGRAFLFVTIPANGTTDVYLLPDTGVVNPNEQTLNVGNIVSSQSAIGRTALYWDINSFDDIASAPANRMGMFYPTQYEGAGPEITDFGFEADDGTNGVRFRIWFDVDGHKNDYNAMRALVGVEADSSNALSGFRFDTTTLSTVAQGYVKYKTRTSRTWITAATFGSSVISTSAIDMDDAIDIIMGIEYIVSDPGLGGIGIDIDTNTTGQLDFDTSKDVSVVESNITYQRLNGTITNTTTGLVVTFDNFICPAGTVTIDTAHRIPERAITVPAGGPTLGHVRFSHDDRMMDLVPGSNAFSVSGVTLASLVHRDAYNG